MSFLNPQNMPRPAHPGQDPGLEFFSPWPGESTSWISRDTVRQGPARRRGSRGVMVETYLRKRPTSRRSSSSWTSAGIQRAGTWTVQWSRLRQGALIVADQVGQALQTTIRLPVQTSSAGRSKGFGLEPDRVFLQTRKGRMRSGSGSGRLPGSDQDRGTRSEV